MHLCGCTIEKCVTVQVRRSHVCVSTICERFLHLCSCPIALEMLSCMRPWFLSIRETDHPCLLFDVRKHQETPPRHITTYSLILATFASNVPTFGRTDSPSYGNTRTNLTRARVEQYSAPTLVTLLSPTSPPSSFINFDS